MGLFGSKKNDKVVDLSNYYRKQQERKNSLKENQQMNESSSSVPVASENSSSGMFGIFGGSTPQIKFIICNKELKFLKEN
ncbi:MAG: hypothetical protein QT05_C0024G0004 [archaeon GW2011_AR13]|nr:MAG: hypothetical protein QT05_C0024G0004 [archaeon GW2011_AR13]